MTSMIDEAKKLVSTQRQEDYGDINESFQRIAGLWSSYIDKYLDKYDVAKMMMLLKVSRAKDTNHRDSYVDIVGYVDCVDQLMALDELKSQEFKRSMTGVCF